MPDLAGEKILAKVYTGTSARDAEKLNAKDAYDVRVIGGGNSGVEAAMRRPRPTIRSSSPWAKERKPASRP